MVPSGGLQRQAVQQTRHRQIMDQLNAASCLCGKVKTIGNLACTDCMRSLPHGLRRAVYTATAGKLCVDTCTKALDVLNERSSTDE